MTIKLLAFGIARDIVGDTTFSLEVAEGLQVGQLKELILEQYPDFQQLSTLAIAVNQRYVEEDCTINATDELVLIPPVSGG